jgi:hypothetical protein
MNVMKRKKRSTAAACWMGILTLALPAALPAADLAGRSSEEPPAAETGVQGTTEPVGTVKPRSEGSDDVSPVGGTAGGPIADIVPDGATYGDAQLRHLTVLPGTFIQGSVDVLTDSQNHDRYLELRAIPDENRQCSIAVIFGFEAPTAGAIRELELTYRSPGRRSPATVAVLAGVDREPIPLACDAQSWWERGTLRCDIPTTLATRVYDTQRILEIFMMIEGRCPDVQTDDAVAISKVHLGPPPGDPMPPPPV